MFRYFGSPHVADTPYHVTLPPAGSLSAGPDYLLRVSQLLATSMDAPWKFLDIADSQLALIAICCVFESKHWDDINQHLTPDQRALLKQKALDGTLTVHDMPEAPMFAPFAPSKNSGHYCQFKMGTKVWDKYYKKYKPGNTEAQAASDYQLVYNCYVHQLGAACNLSEDDFIFLKTFYGTKCQASHLLILPYAMGRNYNPRYMAVDFDGNINKSRWTCAAAFEQIKGYGPAISLTRGFIEAYGYDWDEAGPGPRLPIQAATSHLGQHSQQELAGIPIEQRETSQKCVCLMAHAAFSLPDGAVCHYYDQVHLLDEKLITAPNVGKYLDKKAGRSAAAPERGSSSVKKVKK